jgi:5-methyltetrahydrofolate--homocysteine methyltransferase
MSDFLKAVRERVVIYDGAMGTCIQQYSPTLDDFWGKENCSEVLNLSRPEMIREIHASYLEVGADVVETNTFGGSRIVLAEFGLQDRLEEINRAAVQLAKEVATSFSRNGKPRFVAGSIGPTTKLPSLGHITFNDMVASYVEQAVVLLQAGVDVLLVETSQDLLQAKCATVAMLDAMKKVGRRVPLQVQVTLQDENGTMLLGTDIGAALAALEPYDLDIFGLNCATGPQEMNDAVRYLGLNSPKEISVLPNAGLPENVGGVPHYQLTPQELADYHKHFIVDYGVRVVGGCCGTNPEYIKSVHDTCANLTPAKREVKLVGAASSAYKRVLFDTDAKPLMIAEEMNAPTSAEFRDLVKNGNYDEILATAKQLVGKGSHMLDVCCAVVGEDENSYMDHVMAKIATRVSALLLVDSTEANVIETALKRMPGKAIISSINLEDGEQRMSKVLSMAKRYGAAVVALTIDEDGMALTADRKVAVAKRIFKLATEKYGIRPVDIIIDPLTLPISTGSEEDRMAAMETLKAVRMTKEALPEAHTLLRVSKISLGLSTDSRRVVNSVYMQEAVKSGLDMAIFNHSDIDPFHKIAEAEVELATKLIYQDWSNGDPLQMFVAHFAEQAASTARV